MTEFKTIRIDSELTNQQLQEQYKVAAKIFAEDDDAEYVVINDRFKFWRRNYHVKRAIQDYLGN